MAEEGLPPVEAQPEGEEFAVPEVQEKPGYILVSLPATPEKAAPGEATRGESAAESAAAEPEQAARGESAPAQQARSASEPVVYAAAIPAAPILAEPVKAMQLPKAESAAPQKMPSAGALVYLVVYMHAVNVSSMLTLAYFLLPACAPAGHSVLWEVPSRCMSFVSAS